MASIWSEQLAIPRLKYNGGGDWYNGRTEIPNILRYFSKELHVQVDARDLYVQADSNSLFDYPMVFMTGHGKVIFSNLERQNLKKYCENGGFLYIDDDYGLDKYIRPELKKIFPNKKLVPLPYNFKLFNIWFKFSKGLPQIHVHYQKPPVAYGIFDDSGNLMVLYTYNSNISDGWDSQGVHPSDSNEIRETALKMGANIILYALTY
ncbi:DUF4159 domain-containing protein [bacterium]|nr:DUF4159 domain-containing protein [bacterium]